MITSDFFKKWSKFFLPVLSMSIFLIIWQVLHLIIGGDFLPSPVQVFKEAQRMFSVKIGGNTVWMHIYYSLRRVVIAYLLGAATGIPIGMYMGWNLTFDKIVKPVFEVLRPIPPIAWIPIAIIWLGIGEAPKIFICYVGAFVIFVLNSYTGMRYTDPLLIAAARTYGATRHQQLFNVAIPASMPSVFAGVQNALSMSWMCVLAAELVGAREGVGFLIIQGMDMYKPSMIMVGMIIIGIIGALLAIILRRFERLVCPWRRDLT
jgi:NitT/TauT family transport system permease protein/sulfonate transport system permease protein